MTDTTAPHIARDLLDVAASLGEVATAIRRAGDALTEAYIEELDERPVCRAAALDLREARAALDVLIDEIEAGSA